MAIMVGITGVIFSLVDPSRGTYRAQPQVSDMQQRLRVGTTFLTNDLLMAGAGSPAGGACIGIADELLRADSAYRIGWHRIRMSRRASSIARTRSRCSTSRRTSPQTTVSDAMPQPSSELKVNAKQGCTGARRTAAASSTRAARHHLRRNGRLGRYDDHAGPGRLAPSAAQQGIPGNNCRKNTGPARRSRRSDSARTTSTRRRTS